MEAIGPSLAKVSLPPSMCRWALLFTALAWDAQAEASVDSGLQIDWTGPPECGSPDLLEQETRKLLGARAQEAKVVVDAQALRLESGIFRVELVLSGQASGARSLESRDCNEAIQAASVVLALAINPNALSPEPRPTSPSSEPEDSTPAEESQPTSPNRAPKSTQVLLGLDARLSGGISPWPSWGLSARAGLSRRRFLGSLEPYVLPGYWQSFDSAVRTKIAQSGIDANACAAFFQSARLDAHACAGLKFAFLKAKSEGLEEPESQKAFVLAPRFGLNLRAPLAKPLSLVFSGNVEIPTSHPHFVIEGEEGEALSVHQVELGATFSLGLEAALPVF